MMGRSAGNDFTDEPTWREKWEDWRSNPLWVPGRPSWMAENLTTLALLFLGIAAVILAAVYLVVPPASLPEAMPGYFSVAKAEAAARKVPVAQPVPIPTVPAKERAAVREDMKTWSVEKQQRFWGWVAAVGDYRAAEAEANRIAQTPRQPPTRAWPYALVFGVGAVIVLVGAWRLSDTRQQRDWGT